MRRFSTIIALAPSTHSSDPPNLNKSNSFGRKKRAGIRRLSGLCFFVATFVLVAILHPTKLSAQTFIFGMDGGSCNPHGPKPQILQIDTTSGSVVATYGPLTNCAGEGVALVGNYLYYTTALSKDVYRYDITDGTDTFAFTVKESSQGLASIAYDGKNFYFQDLSLTSPTSNIFVYNEKFGTYVKTITLSNALSPCRQFNQTFCDGLEYVRDGNLFGGQEALISNRGAAVDPYDVYDTSGSLRPAGTAYINASGDSGIAWDGSNFYTSAITASHGKPQPLLDVWSSSGMFLRTMTLSGARVGANIEDLAAPAPMTGGTWQPLANSFPGTPDVALLLTDGTVMVQGFESSNWWRLAPDKNGSYLNGEWSALAPMPSGYAPFAYASAVLPDGRVLIEGGEYNFGLGLAHCSNAFFASTNCGAIYDPVADTWTEVPPPDFGDTCGPNGSSWCIIGGAPSVILPDGTFMMGHAGKLSNGNGAPARTQALLPPPYDTMIKPWIPTGMHKHDANDEEGWTLLPNLFGPDGLSLVMTVDTYTQGTSDCAGSNSSEIYARGAPFGNSAGNWYCLGNTPDMLHQTYDNEMGPAILRPDGTVFATGANANSATAILDGKTFYWTKGPTFPRDGNNNPLTMEDAPTVLLPNGNVLMMAAPGKDTGPVAFFELTYGTNTLVKVSSVSNINDIPGSSHGSMLMLPNGQAMWVPNRGAHNNQIELYTPFNPTYNPAWAPQICNGYCGSTLLMSPQGGTFTGFSGKRFNGMSQGAAFGDEYQSATNYPLVRLTFSNGLVVYCRTHDHSSMGVATGDLTVSTSFDCPALPEGAGGVLQVVANGIPSNPQGFFVEWFVVVPPNVE